MSVIILWIITKGIFSVAWCTSQTYLLSALIGSQTWFLKAQLCLTVCNPVNRSTPGLPVHHQLPEFLKADSFDSQEIVHACLVPQSCPALCDPVDCSLPGSFVHGDSPGKNTGVGCHALLQGLLNPVIESRSPALQVDSLPCEPPQKPNQEIDST